MIGKGNNFDETLSTLKVLSLPSSLFDSDEEKMFYNTGHGSLIERGRICTIDHLVLTSIDQLLFILKIFFSS